MKPKMRQAAAILEARPETAELVPGLQRRFAEAKRSGWWLIVGALALLLAMVSVVTFFAVMWQEPGMVSRMIREAPLFLLLWPLANPLPSVLGLGLFIVGGIAVRRLYLSARLSRYLGERAEVNPEVVAEAQRAISIEPADSLFRTSSIAVGAFLLATGAVWAFLVYAATSSALECARSSKCI
ncbi:MAG: hypothetical protein LBO20_03775 [Bifidobacteriaceae bacterium]|nr:hypothetical protein [Bifidobacteriaceae bacterium]